MGRSIRRFKARNKSETLLNCVPANSSLNLQVSLETQKNTNADLPSKRKCLCPLNIADKTP